MTTVLSTKDPSEVDDLFFDFSDRLSTGETISSVAVSVTTYKGTDPTPSAILSGSANITSGLVRQRVTAGVAGCDYKVRCTATTVTGRVLVMASIIPVQEA